jgi:hypothetical protein
VGSFFCLRFCFCFGDLLDRDLLKS